MITPGKVSAPDGPLKQNIADKGDAGFWLMKDNVAGCVARAMIHAECDIWRTMSECP